MAPDTKSGIAIRSKQLNKLSLYEQYNIKLNTANILLTHT